MDFSLISGIVEEVKLNSFFKGLKKEIEKYLPFNPKCFEYNFFNFIWLKIFESVVLAGAECIPQFQHLKKLIQKKNLLI
jgi:hypothetical protein